MSSQDELMEVELIEGNPAKTTKIPRGENGRADLLSKMAVSLVDCRSRSVTLMDMTKSTLDQVLEVEEQKDWRSPLIQWLQEPVTGKDIRETPLSRHDSSFFSGSDKMVFRSQDDRRLSGRSSGLREASTSRWCSGEVVDVQRSSKLFHGGRPLLS
ncbi:pentatricopeptide (PPR) repeat-containing protein [Striga asiatica]|uniref:Pentatricopeptide (PPR) repeat-containing protein n=1 Tax=Striga asiatica TaxID=4170 RepID=A0A5A7NYB9_STRAF|nr:pentatricopeptide (PPR) repeat-containing protein [Striga asiatica]